MAATTETDIDILLERYLGLLDDYVSLQAKLSELHSALFQNLAKANFLAQRGVRYGQDYYDERMQAIRSISFSDTASPASPVFNVIRHGPGSTTPKKTEQPEKVEVEDEGETGNDEEAGTQEDDQGEEPPSRRKDSGDPLRWFGILTPMPLRQAQKQAVETIEDVIPRLATLSTRMVEIEVQVRRARKKKAKAEKLEQHSEQTEQTDHNIV